MTSLETLGWRLAVVHRAPLSSFVHNALYARLPVFAPVTLFHSLRERVIFERGRRKSTAAKIRYQRK